MNKIYSLCIISCKIFLLMLFGLTANAQGIYQLYGTTTYGGPDDNGTFFTTRFDGTGHDVKKFFTVPNPGKPAFGNRPTVFNGKLYSILQSGGLHNAGIICEYDPGMNTYSKKIDLFPILEEASLFEQQAIYPSLTLFNGKFYGVVQRNSIGHLFEYDPGLNSLTKKITFDDALAKGYNPSGDLVVFNNKLYGLTSSGGINAEGVIYEYDPGVNMNNFKKIADFQAAISGSNPYGALTVHDGKLWGATNSGGNNDGGKLYCFDFELNQIVPKADLVNIGAAHNRGGLALLNGKLYGNSFDGTIFEFNPANDELKSKLDVTPNSIFGWGGEFIVHNNKLFCLTRNGGPFDDGKIFSFDPSNDEFKELMPDLNEATGHTGTGSMVIFNNKFYGWTEEGAANGQGCLFEYDPDQNSYTKKVELGGSDLYYPSGKLFHHNNKIYGTAWGSDYTQTQSGGIYEYDIATKTYTLKLHMQYADGRTYGASGFLLHNNKFYGTAYDRGINDGGVLFEYDPVTNSYVKLHIFDEPTGRNPVGTLVKIGNKLFGVCHSGGAGGADFGNIFEYNLDNNIYAERKVFGPNLGEGHYPEGGLTLFQGKLYGTTITGGNNQNDGTLFEFDPANDNFLQANFSNISKGRFPRGDLKVFNNKLYGVTSEGGLNGFGGPGTIYEYDWESQAINKKITFPDGRFPLTGFTILNNKFYGMTYAGGNLSSGGVLFEYDLATNNYVKKIDFVATNGRKPEYCELTPAPAPTASGTPGFCAPANNAVINATNANSWVAFTDATGEAVAEINANGNILGNVSVNFYVHNGPVRADGGGRLYLDRNITIDVQNQPQTPVSVRLYIKKTEFETFKNFPGSGVVNPEDLGVFKNEDNCSANLNAAAVQIPSVFSTWGFDYVYAAEVNSFSSFYFASKIHQVLPISIISFTGKKDGAVNKLEWKASCTNAADFTIERSADGLNFTSIGIIKATQQDCTNPFYFTDENPVNKSYYRLQISENNIPVKYSSTVLLSRDSDIFSIMKFIPNPVSGNTAMIEIESSHPQLVQLVVSDMAGRQVMVKSIQLSAGKTKTALDVSKLSSGTYQAMYEYNGKRIITRFVKK
jgi:uncharacterized repeat protein (TIGR03803 family)